MPRRLVPRQRAKCECHIRAEETRGPEFVPRKLKATLVSREHREVRMPVEDRFGSRQVCLLFEIDRLRELDDLLVGERRNDDFSEVLLVQPQITEIPATVQQNDPVLDPCPK